MPAGIGRSRLRFLLILVALLAGACGPTLPLDLAVRAIPEDIILGAQGGSPAPAPPPPVVFEPPPAFIFPTFPTFVAPPPPPVIPKACPQAGPFATPDIPASAYLSGPPTPTTYAWRLSGIYQKDATKSGSVAFPTGGYRVVNNVTAPTPAGTYTYDVTDTAAGSDGREQVTTTFEVIPQNTNPPDGQTVTQAAGIFITKIAVKNGTTFTAGAPLTVLNLPVSAGLSWDTASSDPTIQTTIKLHGSVDSTQNAPGGHRRVDACGRIIDSWEVHATGSLVSPTQNLALDWYYDVATQYGGITVQETETINGPDSGLAGSSALSQHMATIDVVPGF